MFDPDLWPKDYATSREMFLTLARSCGAHLRSVAVNVSEDKWPETSQALSIDVASFIAETDTHRIVLTSGLHGVEGFIGACIQLHALTIIAQDGLPDNLGVIMIHAVNPWGYAHCRRVDENNVDVNRNFIDFSNNPLRSPADYLDLDPIINPKLAPSFAGELNYWCSAGKLIIRNRGIEKLAGPIAEGQCHYPQGLFYGGQNISASRSRLEELLVNSTRGIPTVTVLDVHSGLGPSGVATLISNSNRIAHDKRLQWLTEHYQMPALFDSSPENAYNACGSLSQWCGDVFSEQQFLFLCIEIGTVNPIKLFSALRRENQAHHWAQPSDRAYMQTKNTLRDVFAPNSKRWRKKAVEEGVSAFKQSLHLPNKFI